MTLVQDPERIPDWLLGGRVRRRILERLTDSDGWTARELSSEINAGEATVFEVFRGLKGVKALEEAASGRYRLSPTSAIASALKDLIDAAGPYSRRAVDRPPSRRVKR